MKRINVSPVAHSILFTTFVVLAFIYILESSNAGPSVDQVASKLSCYCGTCPHLVVAQCGCSTAAEIKVEVQQQINAGKTEKQILDGFVQKYGQTVLATPPKTGFNLTAWLLPFAGFLFGGVVLFSFLKKSQIQVETKPKGASTENSSTGESEEHYLDQLKRELENRE